MTNIEMRDEIVEFGMRNADQQFATGTRNWINVRLVAFTLMRARFARYLAQMDEYFIDEAFGTVAEYCHDSVNS